MEPPSNATSLKRFLGLCNFFRDYIPNMPSCTQHLRQLLKKDMPFQWTTDHTKEFEDLKGAVTSPNVMLFHPDWNCPFELHFDASKLGCGAMLAQCKDNSCCDQSDLHQEPSVPQNPDGTRCSKSCLL